MLQHAIVVFRKEIIDAVRDRRSLLSASMYAVWAPVAVGIALSAIARDRAPDQPLTVAIQGGERAEALVRYLQQQSVTLVDRPVDLQGAVRSHVQPVALLVRDEYGARFEDVRPAPVELIFDGSRPASVAQADRLRRLLNAYDRQVADTRLLLRGITPEVADAVKVEDRDLSSAASRAGRMLAMLPVFLLVAAFAGSMSVAIDATAGERERNSLESLLIHPVSPASIVLGKWGAAALVSAATLVLMVVITAAVLSMPQIRSIDLPIGLSSNDAVVVLLILVPLAFLAPALQMLTSVFATSYKEAQTQVSLLLLVPTIPGFLLAFGSLTEKWWHRIAPILSQQLLVSDVLAGRMPGVLAILLPALATMVAALAAIVVSARLITRERVARGTA
jgi:sodium transport system permease protein